MTYFAGDCDVAVIGAGHAGIEAALAAARLGWLDLRACRDESLLAIRRAGADLILTYFAESYARDFRA